MGHKRKKEKRANMKLVRSSAVDDHHEDLAISQFSTLSICVEPKYDFPHPRHLCFRFPFASTSHHLHCVKCYCYVCEEVAPCRNWSKPLKGHCHATEEDETWTTEREARKKVPATNLTMAHHILTVSFMQYPPDQPELINGYAGGLISDSSGEWVAGFSKHVYNLIGARDPSVLPLLTLSEALKLAWSKGLRFLEVRLGFQYHDGFWLDFVRDAASGKFHVLADESSPDNVHRVWSLVREVENRLNQDWFITVRNTASHKEESGAVAMASLARIKPLKQVYDFPSHPLTGEFKNLAKLAESKPEYYRGNAESEDDLRVYAGLAP